MHRTDLKVYRPDLALFLPAAELRSVFESEVLGVLRAEAASAGVELGDVVFLSRNYVAARLEGVIPLGDPVAGRARVRVVVTALPSFAKTDASMDMSSTDPDSWSRASNLMIRPGCRRFPSWSWKQGHMTRPRSSSL